MIFTLLKMLGKLLLNNIDCILNIKKYVRIMVVTSLLTNG